MAESAFYELELEESGILSPLPIERRRSQRLQAVPNQALLEWWDCSQKRSSKGYILNISNHGALVFCDSFPPRGENVLLRLERPVQSDWIASIVVRHDQQDEVAVDFNMGFSYDLELAATLGIDIISSVLGLSGADRFSNSGDVDEADPIRFDTLTARRLAHRHPHQVVCQGIHRQFLEHSIHCHALQHIHLHRLLQRLAEWVLDSANARPSRVPPAHSGGYAVGRPSSVVTSVISRVRTPGAHDPTAP